MVSSGFIWVKGGIVNSEGGGADGCGEPSLPAEAVFFEDFTGVEGAGPGGLPADVVIARVWEAVIMGEIPDILGDAFGEGAASAAAGLRARVVFASAALGGG